MPAANLIQLRQLLAEKFPGRSTRAGDRPARTQCWATGLAAVDEPLHGGLPRSALTEIVVERPGCGGARLLGSLLRRAARENQFAALVDGNDSFDVTQFPPDLLSRLLWVRCRAADEALKAADLLLRDGNLPLVALDLAANSAAQLRKIPATAWYRLQRLVEPASTVAVVLTPWTMVAPARARVVLRSRLSLADLEREPEELAAELKPEVLELRRAGQRLETLHSA